MKAKEHMDKGYGCNSLLLFGVNVLRGHAGLYRLSRLYSIPRSRIVSPYYWGTVHSVLELITGVLLSRLS